MSNAVRAVFFDASALVKVYTVEEHSPLVKRWFAAEATKYTTPFCFYETLGVFKAKWLLRKTLTLDEYQRACFHLTAWYGAATHRIQDIDFTAYEVLPLLRRLVAQYGIDASDAFQIISVTHGYFKSLVGESKTVFVTADEELAKAAKAEGLRVTFVGDPAVANSARP